MRISDWSSDVCSSDLHGDSEERERALDIFYQRYRDNPLVLDKWFQVQAWSLRPDTVDAVKELARHPDFTLANPNRVRALYGALTGNQDRKSTRLNSSH